MGSRTQAGNSANDYVIRTFDDPADIDRHQWNALLECQSNPTPFMRHEYLCALQGSSSACAQTGWSARFVALESRGILVAACPLYLKDHSYGEYVFDWAWADAYQRHGLEYYPKLLCAVPFTPVAGTRMLAIDATARLALVRAVQAMARDLGLSSIHMLFGDVSDQQAAAELGWLPRTSVQFHWNNRAAQPYASFDEFLASLVRDKRKKIAQERRRVHEAGVDFSALQGAQITPLDWDFFYRCYTLTYRAHRSTPYLTRAFFAAVSASLSPHWLMFVASRAGQRIAASLIALDPQRRVAYGRYWGAIEAVHCLHFEACYYQPLAWCIAQRYQRFEGGAQGEHKMARGLLPVQTGSSHWLAHPNFSQAVANFLEREGEGIGNYLDELTERRPYKRELLEE